MDVFPLELGIVQASRSVQRFLDVGADVVDTHVALEFGLAHQLRGLLARSTEYQSAA